MRIAIVPLTLLLVACGTKRPTSSGEAPTPIEGRLDALVARTLAATPLLDLQVAVVQNGKPLLVRAYGSADLEKRVPLTLDTIMEIGSVTKQFTAVAALQLVDAKKLGLGDAVATYVPGIPAGITIADLLHQTSGLVDFALPENLDKTPDAITAWIVSTAPGFAPGARWEYSNSNYFLLGRIVEKVSGQSYGAYLQEHLFVPAGLAATHVCGPDDHVVGTVAQAGKVVAGDPFAPAFYGGAGALCSTTGDLLRFQDALLGGKLLATASLAFMTTPGKLADGSATTYGAGLFADTQLGEPRLWHNGGVPDSAEAQLEVYPDAHLQIALLTRTLSVPPGLVLANLARAIAAEMLLSARVVDPALAARLVGKYTVGLGNVYVRSHEDGLSILIGDQESRLLYQSGRDFVLARNPQTTYRFAADGASIEVLVDGKAQAKAKRAAR
jgi:CubicO group peptidase (beta-lactamase class C family)